MSELNDLAVQLADQMYSHDPEDLDGLAELQDRLAQVESQVADEAAPENVPTPDYEPPKDEVGLGDGIEVSFKDGKAFFVSKTARSVRLGGDVRDSKDFELQPDKPRWRKITAEGYGYILVDGTRYDIPAEFILAPRKAKG